MDERFFYQVMNELYKLDAPIVFKGALVTKIVLSQFKNTSRIERKTKDIDGDWVGKEPDPKVLEQYITKAVKNIDSSLSVMQTRDFSENCAAGFNVLNDRHEKVTSLDISIKKNPYKQLYDLDGFRFYGATVDKILADKFYSLSTNHIVRRSKDLLDIYALSYCVSYHPKHIQEILNLGKRTMGDFSYFHTHKHDLEHAYDKLKVTDSTYKPSFSEVYSKVDSFTKPLQPEKSLNPIKQALAKRDPQKDLDR